LDNVDVGQIWDVGKKLGTVFFGDKGKVTARMQEMETIDDKAWEKSNKMMKGVRLEEGAIG
ncbi:hypothetical protein Ancab_008730, partial [Ancistrocladus abbreviatus]